MPYDILCDECDFHKVAHRRDQAEDERDGHADETGHSLEIKEYRMNYPDYPEDSNVSDH
ncbi:MAG: hypothetical protein ABEH40_00510 [Haloferacaceae archaeon]